MESLDRIRNMISFGILSFMAPKTLEHTLSTYKKSGLLNLSDDIFVVIQFSTKQNNEVEVCKKFGIRSICLPDNGRMAWGFKAIFENARHEHILFLENDFVNKNSDIATKEFIENSIYFIDELNADIVRGRSRKDPGDPNYAYLNLRHIPPESFCNNTHLSECIFWVEHPEVVYPSQISKIISCAGSSDWYSTSSRYCNYTNNPFICKKTFFKHAILPFIEFGKDLEPELTPVWSSQNYKCVFGPGLFTHERSFDGK